MGSSVNATYWSSKSVYFGLGTRPKITWYTRKPETLDRSRWSVTDRWNLAVGWRTQHTVIHRRRYRPWTDTQTHRPTHPADATNPDRPTDTHTHNRSWTISQTHRHTDPADATDPGLTQRHTDTQTQRPIWRYRPWNDTQTHRHTYTQTDLTLQTLDRLDLDTDQPTEEELLKKFGLDDEEFMLDDASRVEGLQCHLRLCVCVSVMSLCWTKRVVGDASSPKSGRFSTSLTPPHRPRSVRSLHPSSSSSSLSF